MKILLAISLSLILSSSFAQWEQQNSGTNLHLNSVYFIDTFLGYAVGDSGTILKTIDGGTNWLDQNYISNRSLYSVYFCDSLTGFCVGNGGTIISTSDGGVNWDIDTLSEFPNLTSIHFSSDSIGYIVGDKQNGSSYTAVIYKTIDKGNNWNINYETSGVLSSVFTPNLNDCYAVGRRPNAGAPAIMVKTTDGGNNWNVIEYSGESCSFSSVYFVDNDTGFITGLSWPCGTLAPLLFKTFNGNNTLFEISLGHFGITSLFFFNKDNGYGVGRNIWGGLGTILKFEHEGEIWKCQDSTFDSGLNDIHFPNIDTGFVVGQDGFILKTTNGGEFPVDMIEIQPEFISLSIFPNPFSTSTTIEYELNQLETVTITFYNQFGKQVDMIEEKQQKGLNKVVWKPEDQPMGIYYFRIRADKQYASGKLIKVE